MKKGELMHGLAYVIGTILLILLLMSGCIIDSIQTGWRNLMSKKKKKGKRTNLVKRKEGREEVRKLVNAIAYRLNDVEIYQELLKTLGAMSRRDPIPCLVDGVDGLVFISLSTDDMDQVQKVFKKNKKAFMEIKPSKIRDTSILLDTLFIGLHESD